MLRMLEPRGRGAFVQVTEVQNSEARTAEPELPDPAPPLAAIGELVRQHLGPDRRAGQGIRNTSPGGETIVLERAGFSPPSIIVVPGAGIVPRSLNDIVASVFSQSRTAPHLFGDRLSDFEADLRALLTSTSPSRVFAEQAPDTEVRIWRTPPA